MNERMNLFIHSLFKAISVKLLTVYSNVCLLYYQLFGL